MNTSKRILGSVFLIVSGVWLFGIHTHTLAVLIQRTTHSRSAVLDLVQSFPPAPNYYAPFRWASWWPALIGFAGIAIGAGLGWVSRPRADQCEENERIPRK